MAIYILTGATGVLGSYILKDLVLAKHEVRIIVRAKDKAHLQQRVDKLIKFYELSPENAKNIKPYRGDIYKKNFGLSEAELLALFTGSMHFIHSAASLNLNQDRKSALEQSSFSTKELIRICKKYGFTRKLKKIEVISTVGVGGQTEVNLKEVFLKGPREFHNNYELAKSTSEDILLKEINKGVPMTVHRPSMIIGDSRQGKIYSFQVFYYILKFLSGKLTLGFLPCLGDKALDVINVDFVSKAVIATSQDMSTAGRIIHECSGPGAAPLLKDLALLYGERLQQRGFEKQKIRFVSARLVSAVIAVVNFVLPRSYKKKFKPVPHFLKYLRTPQKFYNCESTVYLKSIGVEPISPDSYLKKAVDYYLVTTAK